jgi:hypothetical protein
MVYQFYTALDNSAIPMYNSIIHLLFSMHGIYLIHREISKAQGKADTLYIVDTDNLTSTVQYSVVVIHTLQKQNKGIY